jgi:hypothetical protein
MAADEVKPDKAAPEAAAESVENPSTTAADAALKGASDKSIAEVQQTQGPPQQSDACVAKMQTENPQALSLFNDSTFRMTNDKIGGECGATDSIAEARKELTAQNENQQIKIETTENGTRIESRIENGRIIAQRSVFGDTTTLRTYDEKGNLATTFTEKGIGDNMVQTWTFPDGDFIRIKADGTVTAEVNGRRIEGLDKAQVQSYIRQALADQSFTPKLDESSVGTDLHGSAMLTLGDKRTGALVTPNGDLNVFTADKSGIPQRNLVTFSGDTMIMQGPNGELMPPVKAASFENGVYTFMHSGMTFQVRDNKVQNIATTDGDVDRVIAKGEKGWQGFSIQRRVSPEGIALPDAKVVTGITEPGVGQIQTFNGDEPLQTTVMTLEQRTTYKGDGTDLSPDNIILQATNDSLSTPEIVRQGNMTFDATGSYSDKDHFGPGVYYDVVSGKNLTNTQLLQFASFAAAMSSQVGSFQNYFEGVTLGANGELPSVDAKIGQIQAFMGYVNCNVNGSRYVGMLVMANQALESGNAARCRAGVVQPDQVSQEAGFQDPGLVARRGEDVRLSLALINGGKSYNSEVKVANAEDTLPPLTLVRKV